ncbi:MAG: hypothetical protein OXB98_09185 [Bryobacterales bacterium]|nr:hypothetical protein [Bryobacterales bacterium]
MAGLAYFFEKIIPCPQMAGETYESGCSSCINKTPDFGATNSALLKILKKDIPIKMCPAWGHDH